jgi:hypothetical protein
LPFDEMLPAAGCTCSAPFLIELSDLMAALRVWAKLSLIGHGGEWLLHSSSDDKCIMQAVAN